MLVQLFIMMCKPKPLVRMYALDDMIMETLRMFPNWLNCEVYTIPSRELTDARVFYPGIEQLPIRVLHHSTV